MSFASWEQRGFAYDSLIPVVPVDGVISPNSAIKPEFRGKVPGLLGQSGWYGYAWENTPLKPEVKANAERNGCNIGLRSGAYPALDIDILDEALAQEVEALAREYLGNTNVRVGRAPKRLMMYRASEPFAKTRLKIFRGEESHIIEMLAEGQQYVVEGTHPVTKSPYTWDALPCAESLPEVSGVDVGIFFSALQDLVISRGWTTHLGESHLPSENMVPQDSLVAPSEAEFERVVALLPNTTDHFPKREDYINVAYMLKAAGAPWPDTAERCWLDWCARWKDGNNDVDDALSDWKRCQPPYRSGWGSLTETLAKTGNPQPSVHLSPVESAFVHAPFAKPFPMDFDPSKLRTRQWVLGTRFMKGAVTGGVGAPGVGKSMFSILTALAIATGRNDITGEEVHKKGVAWIHNNEDDMDEIYRRVAGAMRHYKIRPEDVRDRLFVTSGAERRLRVAVKESNVVRWDEAVDEIVSQIRARHVTYMAIDPFVSTYDGINENDNSDLEKVISAFRYIAQETDCALDLVHHSVKNHSGNTEARAGDANSARGASSLIGAVRCAYTLSAMSAKSAEALGIDEEDSWSYARLDSGKNNYAKQYRKPVWYKMFSVDIGNGSGTDVMDAGDTVGVHVLQHGLAEAIKAASEEEDEPEEVLVEAAYSCAVDLFLNKAVRKRDLIRHLAKEREPKHPQTFWSRIADLAFPDEAAHDSRWMNEAGKGYLFLRSGKSWYVKAMPEEGL